LKAVLAVLLLAPSTPLLFMGEEFGASTPFLFFCDFEPDLAAKAREGRRLEFARFAQFSSAEAQAKIPDPNDEETFLRSKLDWGSVEAQMHSDWQKFYRELLACRKSAIVPRVKDVLPGKARFEVLGKKAVSVVWPFAGGGQFALIANLSEESFDIPKIPEGSLVYATVEEAAAPGKPRTMPALSVAWYLKP
jgi:1,4-alpha-glucan branching enzyme